MKAVVVGATGAVGRQLVEQLLQSNAWTTVATVGRRPVEVAPALQGKLQQTVIDMDNLEIEGAPAFAGASTAFCTLGTQRGVAGNADAFRKVDLVYVKKAAKTAKAAGVQHFSLVTAQTSNSKQWASDWLPFHPLLYIKVKGQAEDAVKAQGFPRVTIFRPGLLLGKDANVLLKVVQKVVTGIHVADVARCMRLDAEASGGSGKVIDMAEMLKMTQNAAK